ncbi:unnamed protein product [Urochloa humidicola]
METVELDFRVALHPAPCQNLARRGPLPTSPALHPASRRRRILHPHLEPHAVPPDPVAPTAAHKVPDPVAPTAVAAIVALTLALSLALLLASAYFASSAAVRVRASCGQGAPPAVATAGEANPRRLPQKVPVPAGDRGAEVKYRAIRGRDPGPSAGAEDSDLGPCLRLLRPPLNEERLRKKDVVNALYSLNVFPATF